VTRDDARLMVAAMPFPCRPLMYDAASFPVRNGSSENDSKFRPPRGPRCRQTVGANRTCADLALVSSAKCSPTSYRSFLSHVAASDTPHGKRAAYISMSVDQQRQKFNNLTRVPALKIAPRAPFGPSDVLMLGMPFDGIATVLQ
jgi:hypothetical protein